MLARLTITLSQLPHRVRTNLPINVLHLVSSLDRHDAAVQLCELVRGLRLHDAASDIDSAIVSLRHGGVLRAELAAAAIPVESLRRRFPVDPICLARLTMLLRRRRADAVHLWDADAARHFSLARRFAPQCAALLSHVSDPLPPPKGLEQLVNAVMTTRAANRDRANALGWPSEKLHVIPPGVDSPVNSAESREDVFKGLSLPSDAAIVCVAGQLTLANRVRQLIWAFDLIRVLRPSARMLIVGDGPERNNLHRYADRASSLDNVLFLGDRADLPRLLPHVDVFWDGAVSDHLATPLLQAMATGTAVVAVDSAANRELITHGESGYLTALDDRAGRARITDQLLSEHSLRERVGKAAQRVVGERCAIENMIDAYARLYRDVVSG